jgi:hypothetical protein
MDHAALSQLVAGGVLGDVDVDERRALDAHLPACDGCRSLARDLTEMIGDLALLAPARPVPVTLGVSVLERIRSEGDPRAVATAAR